LLDANEFYIEDCDIRMKRPTVIFSLVLLTTVAVILFATRPGLESRRLSQAEFVALVQSNRLAKVQVYYPAKLRRIDGIPVMLNEVRGTFYQTDAASEIMKPGGVPAESDFVAEVHLTSELEAKFVTGTNFSMVSPAFQKVREWIVRSK
jgi:hypothetical protein